MKILIVDDEQIMRNGLRVTVDWESYGFEIIDAVANGKRAIPVSYTHLQTALDHPGYGSEGLCGYPV